MLNKAFVTIIELSLSLIPLGVHILKTHKGKQSSLIKALEHFPEWGP